MNVKLIERYTKRVFNNLDINSHRRYRSLVRDRAIDSMSEHSHEMPSVVVNYTSEFWHYDRGRYAYLLFIALKRAGFKIYLNNSFSFLSRLTKYKELLLAEEFEIVSDLSLDKDAIWFPSTQRSIVVVNPGSRSKDLYLGKNLPFPYMMHPKIYAEGIDLSLISLRGNEKVGRIFLQGM